MAHRYFLVYYIFTTSLISGQPLTYGLKGLEVSLKPQITEHPDEILWKHNGNKVVEFDNKQEKVYDSYKNRVTLDWISAELNIKDLSYADSGSYELEVFKNHKLDSYSYTLEVIDKLAKPTISCKVKDGSSSNTHGIQATLTCSSDSSQPQSLKFEWITHGNVTLGQNLTIILNDKHDNEEYSCSVSNPLTAETTKFHTKDCFPDESSNVPLIVGLTCCFFFILAIIAVGIIIYKRKVCIGKGKQREEDKQSLPGSHKDQSTPLLDRSPTLPSTQQLRQANNNINPNYPDRDHTDDTESKDHRDEMLPERTVRERIDQIESNRGGQTFPPDTPTDLEKNADNKKTVPPPVPPSSFSQDLNNLPSNDKGDADADQLRKTDSSDSEKATETDPVIDLTGGISSDLQSSPAPEPPGTVRERIDQFDPNRDGQTFHTPTGSVRERINRFDPNRGGQTFLPETPTDLEKNADNKKSVPPPVPPVRKPSFSQDLNNLPSNDKGDADADQLRKTDSSYSEKATETDPVIDLTGDISSDLQSSPAPEPPGLEKNADSNKKIVSSPFPLGSVRERINRFDPNRGGQTFLPETPTESEKKTDKDEEAESPPANGITTPIPKPRSHLTQKSPNVGTKDTTDEYKKDADHQEMDKTVCKDENVDDNEQEEIEKGTHLPLGTPHEPQSPTKPDNVNNVDKC